MAEFIPDYSDIVNLDDAEPLEGPDLVQYQTSIAEKVDEINRLGMPDNQPCNLIDYFDQNKDIKEKVERITMAVKEQEGVLYGCANLTLRENLTPEEYRVVGQYLRGQYSDGWGESLEQREIKVDGGELYLHFYVGAGSDFQIQVKAPENGVQEKQPEQKPSRPELKLLGHDGNIFSILGDAARLLRRAGMSEHANEMADRVHKSSNYYEALGIISEYVETELSPPMMRVCISFASAAMPFCRRTLAAIPIRWKMLPSCPSRGQRGRGVSCRAERNPPSLLGT